MRTYVAHVTEGNLPLSRHIRQTTDAETTREATHTAQWRQEADGQREADVFGSERLHLLS